MEGFYQDRFLLGEGDIMKILIINQHIEDAIGGSEIQCDIIASYLSDFGHKVFYGAINSKRNNYSYNYKVIPIKQMSLRITNKVIKDVSPDIIYWRFNKKSFLKTVILSKLYRVRFVFAVSSFNDTEKWTMSGVKVFNIKNRQFNISFLKKIILVIRNAFISRINYMAFYFVDGVTLLNNDFKDKIPAKKQMLISNSMKTKIIPQEWPKPYIIWVANIKPKKNPEEYIKLVRSLTHTKVDFLMIGSIQDNRYSFLKSRDKIPENLYYLGVKNIEEVNGYIKKSLFLVHTCDPEGFGNNFIQAWLMGKPTVTLYFDPESIIEKNRLGFFSHNYDQMVKDVYKLITDEKLRSDMGKKAKDFAEKKFNPEKNVRKLEDFLLKIIKQ